MSSEPFSNMHHSLLVLCGVLVPPAPQQQPYIPWNQGPESPCLAFDTENTLEWPSDVAYGTPAGFGRTALADLDGDQSTDAVVVADGIPVALWKVAVYDAPERIDFPTQPAPTDVRGIATLPGGGPGARDVLALTDERGLYLVTYGTAAFDDPQVLIAGAWVDAAPIHADDLDGDLDLDLIGIAADGRSLLTMVNTPSGFAPGLGVPLQRFTTDVVPVKWDGDSVRDLVTLNTRGLMIHDASGVLIGSVIWPSGPGCITRFHSTGAPGGELLAWSRVSGSSSSELVVRNHAHSEGPWPLGFDFCGPYLPVTPIALLAGNYDGNPDDELLLVHEGSETAVVLANKGAAPHFDPADPFALDVIPLTELPTVPGGVGIPAFGQVDGMLFDDLVFPVVRTERVEVFRMLPFQRAAVPSPNSMVVVSNHTEFGPVSATDPTNHLRLAFAVPSKYAAYTMLDLIVWEQLSVESPVELDAVYHARHPLLTDGGSTVSPATQWVDVELPFPAFGTGECWEDGVPPQKPNYYPEMRFVRVDPLTLEEARSPVYVGGFTLATCLVDPEVGTDYGYLLQQGIQDKDFFLKKHNGLTGSGVSEQVLGLYVPMSAQPPFALDANPSPGPRLTGSPAWPFTDQ